MSFAEGNSASESYRKSADHDLHRRTGTQDAERLALLSVIGTQSLVG